MTSRGLSVVCAVALAAVAVMARADGEAVLLHEYLPPEPNETLAFTRPGSGLVDDAAAIETPSGSIVLPDVNRTPAPATVYERGAESAGSEFRPDRDTSRPTEVTYDDPFSPQLTPFKRLKAYDAVREDYTLYVRVPQLTPILLRGAPLAGDDRFFGDLSVELRAGEAVAIPSVAADANPLRLFSTPPVPVELLRDGADNWFVRSTASLRVRLVLDLTTPRAGFAADYPDIPWRALPAVPPQPSEHRTSFEQVSKAIGLTPQLSPRQVVTRLTEYFRSFAPSEQPPPVRGNIYLDLALSQKGVCRHRAFAFLVTALNAGLPTRLVSNEAHVWVEVRDDRLWRRIDLGGAGVDLIQPQRPERPQHVPPPDTFAWPTGRDSGDDLGARERDKSRKKPSEERGSNGAQDPSGPDVSPRVESAPDNRPSTVVVLEAVDHDLFRGKPMRLRGHITSDAEACGHVRVDVSIQSSALGERIVGSLVTDEHGVYDGEVGLPRELPVGDYELFVATPGNARCGAARSL